VKAVALAVALAMAAPYQCASNEPARPVEDTAPEALWILAERFKAEGNVSARETTLRQIIDAYPGSRYAQRARLELGIPDPVDSEK
jgi:TolA-binding protein